MENTKYDFIIIGGGTSGCFLANRLSSSKSRPNVLIVEIGDDNSDIRNYSPYERFTNAFKEKLVHDYQTIPQTELDNKKLPYARGRGLGGSSLTNFMVYTRGSSVDYNAWSELVDDDNWNWENTQKRFQKIESFHNNIPKKNRKFICHKIFNQKEKGLINISYQWEKETSIIIEAAKERNYPLNLNVNSGNPIGISLSPVTSKDGMRFTSKMLLNKENENLTILSNTRVTKIIIENDKAIGIETINGKTILANNEVILCSGSIDTPKLLLLSGIGPEKELIKHDINIKKNIINIGENLKDHCGVVLSYSFRDGFSDRDTFSISPKKKEKSYKEWIKNKKGPLTEHNSSLNLIFVKNEKNYETEEFNNLSTE
ncbi:GMC oxidoreductase-domain-containing protein, partial [Sporodiniella umbellata]